MKIILDSNAVLASIAKKSPYRPIFDAFLEEKYTLVISNEVLNEYLEVLTRYSTGTVANNIAELILVKDNVFKSEAYFCWNLITADHDDNKFVDLYVATNSDYIVTNDSHFNVLKKISFPRVNVVDIDAFLKIVEGL